MKTEAGHRNAEIDFLKGILIWGVVFGHTLTLLLAGSTDTNPWIVTFIRTYDMPFFMILSGYFLKKSLCSSSALKVVVNRVTMIFVPICFWTLLRGSFNVFGGLYYFLWAVLASAIVCAMVYQLALTVPIRFKTLFEWLMFCCVAVAFHMFDTPWNLFYLYPFFAVGFAMDALPIRAGKYQNVAIFALWIVGLYFWKTDYSPWRMRSLAWIDDPRAVFLFFYRFVLALCGVHVVWLLLVKLYEEFAESRFVKMIVNYGTETLSIYILHVFLLAVLRRAVGIVHAYEYLGAGLIIYVIAPLMSLFMMLLLLAIIRTIKSLRYIRCTLGFKIFT